jgi:hypothetical protein
MVYQLVYGVHFELYPEIKDVQGVCWYNIVRITADAIQILAAWMSIWSFFTNNSNPLRDGLCFILIFFLSAVAMITSLTSVQSVANHIYNVFTTYKDDHGIIPT